MEKFDNWFLNSITGKIFTYVLQGAISAGLIFILAAFFGINPYWVMT